MRVVLYECWPLRGLRVDLWHAVPLGSSFERLSLCMHVITFIAIRSIYICHFRSYIILILFFQIQWSA